MNWLQRAWRKFKKRWGPSFPSPEQIYEMVCTTPLFREVPEENLRAMLPHAQAIRVREGDVIFREGDEGDFYYLILDGMATVLRRPSPNEPPKPSAVLAPGFAFGEEALISFSQRSSTVIMETNGILLRIPKNAFLDYIVSSLVTFITPGEAYRQVASGARWLDVRPFTDYLRSHLPDALSLPLSELRHRLKEFDPAPLYICYCQTGRAAATAAYLMRLAGYRAAVLQGGLRLLDRRFKG